MTALVENIEEALQQIQVNPPDVAVIDISLNEESGFDLIRRIKDWNKSVRMLVVSMYDEGLFGERALRVGAMGYLNKQVACRNIVDAIRCLLNGQIYVSDELADRLGTRQTTGTDSSKPIGIQLLTERELEVLNCIGAGLTTNQIAMKLYLSIKTIETHRQKIKGKLNRQNAAELSCAAAQWVLLNH